MQNTQPVLSLVVTSRNDNHGGTLLRRMQTFTNCFINQCVRHGLRAELIIVEWNPPAEAPGLIDALQWPAELGPCEVRIIEVPEHIHKRFAHSENLALYQMIAKNVGIRRARGHYVLATNIDILLSDAVIESIARGELASDRMYRTDRLDVDTHVPVDADVDTQLEYCRTNLLRNNARGETFLLNADGSYRAEPGSPSIANGASSVVFGKGCYPVEYWLGESLRWMSPEAHLSFQRNVPHPQYIHFEIEPFFSVLEYPLFLEISQNGTTPLGEVVLTKRSKLSIQVPDNCDSLVLRIKNEILGEIPCESRLLCYRVYESWDSTAEETSGQPADSPCWVTLPHAEPVPEGADAIAETPRAQPNIVFGDGCYLLEEWEGENFRWMSPEARVIFPNQDPSTPRYAHFEIEPCCLVVGYPLNLEILNDDSTLYCEIVVTERSMLTILLPEGCESLTIRTKNDIIYVRPEDTRTICHRIYNSWVSTDHQFSGHVQQGVWEITPLSRKQKAVRKMRKYWAKVSFRRQRAQIPWRRIVSGLTLQQFRSRLSALWTEFSLRRIGTGLVRGLAGSLARLRKVFAKSGPAQPSGVEMLSSLPKTTPHLVGIEALERYPVEELPGVEDLHLNACGDFTLLSRDYWFKLRGYPELELFSLHLDSLFCYMAHHAGAREEVLPVSHEVFHIEHGVGSGWSPEGAEKLMKRMASLKIPVLAYEDIMKWAAVMRKDGAVIFNDEDWGLSNVDLPEATVASKRKLAA